LLLLENSTQASGTASKHRLLTKCGKLPETTGKSSSAKDGNRVKSSERGQVAAASLQSKVTAAKPQFGQDNSEILTTDVLYYSLADHSVPQHDTMDGTEVLGTVLAYKI